MTNTKITAIRILGAMAQYDGAMLPVDISLFSAVKAVGWLLKHGYVYKSKGNFAITTDGRNYYLEAVANPHHDMHKGYGKWKEEVLTGLADYRSKKNKLMVSCESSIKNAALPKKLSGEREAPSPESMLRDKQDKAIKEIIIAAELKVSRARFTRLMADGLVSICPGYRIDRHIGIFHRRGKGLQSLCIECRKRRRKDNK